MCMCMCICVCIYLYTSYAHACTVYICTLGNTQSFGFFLPRNSWRDQDPIWTEIDVYVIIGSHRRRRASSQPRSGLILCRL